jgi:hypothetical protein
MHIRSLLVALTFAALSSLPAFAQLTSVEEAVALSQKTGKPILAMAGQQSCGACVALQERLTTDRSLAVFAGSFIPLKVRTDEGADWGKWARKYPVEGNGIPKFYIIRADGTKMVAMQGAPPDNELPKMLAAAVDQSGRILKDSEIALLDTSVTEAKEAVAAGSMAKAAVALAKLNSLGTLGDLKSYSALALEADALFKQVMEGAVKSIEEAKGKLADKETAFDGVLTLVEGERAYVSFPPIKLVVNKSVKEAEKNAALEDAFKQARALDRARRLPPTGPTKSKAIEAYQTVITRYPGTPAERLAIEELTAIDPSKAATAQQARRRKLPARNSASGPAVPSASKRSSLSSRAASRCSKNAMAKGSASRSTNSPPKTRKC